MKITGYKKSDTEIDGLMVLSDIAIATSSKTLREIATFLQSAADEMDELGADYDHLHLMDEWENWKEGYPDIQVLNNKYGK
jgi:hypothetical protein